MRGLHTSQAPMFYWQAGVEESQQEESSKSGRTSPAPPYLKTSRRSGKLGPSRNPSGKSHLLRHHMPVLPYSC